MKTMRDQYKELDNELVALETKLRNHLFEHEAEMLRDVRSRFDKTAHARLQHRGE